MNTIGSNIAFYRKAKHMTQEELAVQLDVSAQAVSKWENDLTCPDIQQLVPLAMIFETTVDDLLNKDQNRSAQYLSLQNQRNVQEWTLKVIIDSQSGDKILCNCQWNL